MGELDVSFSWKSILKALKSKHVGETGLSEHISEQYCQEQGMVLFYFGIGYLRVKSPFAFYPKITIILATL